MMTSILIPVFGRARTAILGSLVISLCGFATPASAIRFGIDDLAGQYSGVGMILPTAGHPLCTGTMLSNRVFLTAAQCVLDATPSPVFEFTVGPGMTAHATEIRTHPLFSTFDGINLAFDIALVALDEAEVASWSGVTRWVVGEEALGFNAVVTAVGYGETQTGTGSGERRSGNLMFTQYIAGEGPPGVFRPTAFIETIPADGLNNMFCAGDAGGPLLHNDAIAGIASFRFVATCDEDGPGYYLTLGNFADWIRDNVNEMDPAAAVPEPATLALLGVGLAGIGLRRRRI